MAKWIKVTDDYDYRWPSGAVTAFKAGQIVSVKDDVAEALLTDKVAVASDKPKDDYEPPVKDRESYARRHRIKSGGFPGYPNARIRARARSASRTGATPPPDAVLTEKPR